MAWNSYCWCVLNNYYTNNIYHFFVSDLRTLSWTNSCLSEYMSTTDMLDWCYFGEYREESGKNIFEVNSCCDYVVFQMTWYIIRSFCLSFPDSKSGEVLEDLFIFQVHLMCLTFTTQLYTFMELLTFTYIIWGPLPGTPKKVKNPELAFTFK